MTRRRFLVMASGALVTLAAGGGELVAQRPAPASAAWYRVEWQSSEDGLSFETYATTVVSLSAGDTIEMPVDRTGARFLRTLIIPEQGAVNRSVSFPYQVAP